MIKHSSATVSRLAASSPGRRSASLKSPAVPLSMNPTMNTSAAMTPVSRGLSSRCLAELSSYSHFSTIIPKATGSD